METVSTLLALCASNSPVTGEFPAQRPVTRSFNAFFDLRLNKRLSKQSWGWWFGTLSRPLWSHCNEYGLWNMNVLLCFVLFNHSISSLWIYVMHWSTSFSVPLLALGHPCYPCYLRVGSVIMWQLNPCHNASEVTLKNRGGSGRNLPPTLTQQNTNRKHDSLDVSYMYMLWKASFTYIICQVILILYLKNRHDS